MITDPSSLEAQPPPEKLRRFWMVAAVVVAIMVVGAVSVYTWFGLYGPCGRGTVGRASEALFDQVKAFDEAYQSAASAAPNGLMGPVTQMQQALWDTREVSVPACMQVAQMELVTSMESAIRAVVAGMEGKSEETIQGLLEDSKTHLETFTTELEAVKKCAPFCQ